jgi:amino acid transporter
VTAAADHGPSELGRSMRRVGNLLITISAITPAASVFVIGQQVTQQAGTGAIVCFLVAGLLALMTAFVYAELSSAFPLTGAEYSMMGRTMGPSWGFMALGLNLFGTPVSQAVTALGLADYLAVVMPGLPTMPVALAVTVATALVGVLNVRLNAKVTGVFLLVELAALVVMTALGFVHTHNPLVDLTLHPVAPTASGALGPVSGATIGLGMAGAIYAYNGYGGACYFGEEMYEARTRVAWVIFLSLAVGAVAEFLPIVAVLAGAPDLKAVLSADQPYPAFLLAVGGKGVDQIVSLGVAFAIVNAMIAIGLINARQLFCSGRDGVWPGPLNRWAAAVHPRFHSPWIASLVMGAVTIACCFIPLKQLVILSGANIALLYAGVSVAVIAGRINGTTAVGHYRMPLYPLWPICALIGLAGALAAAALDPDEGRPGLIVNAVVMALSAAYYLFYLKRRGGWMLRAADGKPLEELEAEVLAAQGSPVLALPD